ncbi:MAG: hypothetical protein QOI47_590, partial [Actinomycetota bacterium]|nr:hypothetical protein [Actinomycetota bacterium]
MRLRAVVFVALAVTGIVLSGVGAPAVRAPETLPAVPTTLAALDRIADPPTSVATTTTMPPTTTTAPPPPTTTTTRPPAPVRSLSMYNGLGTWIDVYDWSATFGKDGALVDPAAVDQMARAGVQTLYVQTAKWDAPQDVLEPERLLPIIARAKHDGLRVVAWYLPT